MQTKNSVIAQKLLNLYRQEHVIIGGWTTVNAVFIAEATPEVIAILQQLPTGKTLVKHIENLRSGKTPMNSIDHELAPYGGMMEQSALTATLSDKEISLLDKELKTFVPDENGLKHIQNLPLVQQFGDDWIPAIRAALASHPDILKLWDGVSQTYQAYNLWYTANNLINEPISERVRAQLQADMSEYETYLPMFGDDGNKLLGKLRALITTRGGTDSE